MIELIGVKKYYSTGKKDVHALRGVSCILPTGKLISIVGKSGCGKSTLLNLLGGLDHPNSGSITVDGVIINELDQSKLANYRKNKIGMIFQSFNLINSLTAVENIAMALAIGQVARRRRRKTALELLNLVDLTERADHLPAELSGGECQRVAIARALANSPDIILADEPTGNLDSETSLHIINLLKELNTVHKKSIIMVTHDLDYANQFSDLNITMKDGLIINQHETNK